MSRWHDIDFDFSKGMSTNTVNPGTKYARRILNLHNHIKPGALVLRPGYDKQYSKPACNIRDNENNEVITDFGFINFDLFFDRKADENGKEIVCLIQKARIKGLNSDDAIDTLNFWVRPFWNGYQWENEWDWLNKTIITKITAGSDITYPNMIKVYGGINNGVQNNSFNNFTIYNRTKNEFAKVITSKAEGNEIRICHTNYNTNWNTGDVVILSRNWIDLNYLEELHRVNWSEITFHKIINDLKIGFGGYENRPGLTIGYRKRYYQIKKFDFPNIHPDIQESYILENLSKIDEIILDTHILEQKNYKLQINVIDGGSLTAGDYTIRLTGIIDNYEEMLIAEENVQIENNKTIEIIPNINFGIINKRLTGFGVYISNDNINFFKIGKYNITESEFNQGSWKIDNYGKISLISTLQPQEEVEIELNNGANAVSISDANSIGEWNVFNEGNLEVVSDAVDNYAFRYRKDNIVSIPETSSRAGIILPLNNITRNRYYTISAYIKSTTNKIYSFFLGESKLVLNRTQKSINVTGNYQKYDFELFADNFNEAPKYFTLAVFPGKYQFISTKSGKVYRYNGSDWQLSNSGLPLLEEGYGYYIIEFGSRLLAVSTKIYKSDNGGNSWTQITLITNANIIKVINNKIFLGCSDGKIYRSEDGENFTLVSNSISNAITTFANIGNLIFAGVFQSGVYLSNDEGLTWIQKNNGLTNSDVTILFADGNNLYAGTFGGGIFKTNNNGDNWTEVNDGLPNEDKFISAFIKKDNYLLVSLYNADNMRTQYGIYRSLDGNNWIESNAGLTSMDIYDLYIMNDKIMSADSQGRIYQSNDYGQNWSLFREFENAVVFGRQSSSVEFYIDKVSIKEKNYTVVDTFEAKEEMKDELGYNPTFNLVKGWDKALSFKGRTYYLNPFIDKRYENYLMVSHIHSSGAFMYDIASFSNFRELEKYDSNEALSMALLPSMDLLILKDSSIIVLDPETGIAKEPYLGVSLVAKNSIVNMNGIIYWCGGEDIYMYNNGQIIPLLKNTIRDLYLDTSDKQLIFAVRDKHNSYRIRLFKPEQKTEYLYTENGWIEEKKYHFPEVYRAGFRNKLYFLSLGDIYTEEAVLDYNAAEEYVMTGEFVYEL
ncbi:MAG: hypothetical protein QXD05_00205 [Candidatus Pacearchaeota archaeon]